MDFLMDWIWYIVAFAVGAIVMSLIISAVVKPNSEDEALAELAESARNGGLR